ncbi:HK97 family phage prohead protease [Streptomyces barkulensis]|uniref:HK97 family phage prohead protease n=1 Tax=Streptomyces barkulensis TaxID=1257026 RepID=UPI000C6D6174|nr:HK97 family phage prohead protease [Streptomyces barkulensis]
MESKTTRGSVSVKAARSGGGASGTIEAVFATLGVRDHDGDIVQPGAIGSGQVIISDWNHSSWQGARPIGRGRIYVDGNKARLSGRLFLDTAAGREAHAMLKGLGDLAEFSWSLDSIESHMGQDAQGRPTRFITGVKVREVSPVIQAASIGTGLLALKGRGSTRAELAAIKARLDLEELAEIAERNERALHCEAVQAELLDVHEDMLRRDGVGYSRDLDSLVPDGTKDAARAAVVRYAGELGLPDAVRVKWFSAEDEEGHVEFRSLRPLLGRCRPKAEPDTIWLHSALSAEEAHRVAAHELRHLAGGDESEARTYEEKAKFEWLERNWR